MSNRHFFAKLLSFLRDLFLSPARLECSSRSFRPHLVKLDQRPAERPLIIRQQQRRVRPHDDQHVVPLREIMLERSERLAHSALDRIAARRLPHRAADAQSKPGVIQCIRFRIDHNRPAIVFDSRMIHLIELALGSQAMRSGETEVTGGHMWAATVNVRRVVCGCAGCNLVAPSGMRGVRQSVVQQVAACTSEISCNPSKH